MDSGLIWGNFLILCSESTCCRWLKRILSYSSLDCRYMAICISLSASIMPSIEQRLWFSSKAETRHPATVSITIDSFCEVTCEKEAKASLACAVGQTPYANCLNDLNSVFLRKTISFRNCASITNWIETLWSKYWSIAYVFFIVIGSYTCQIGKSRIKKI